MRPHGDTIGHSHSLAGMIAGTVVGVLLIGASVAVGYLTGELATAVRDSIADAGAAVASPTGAILTSSAEYRSAN